MVYIRCIVKIISLSHFPLFYYSYYKHLHCTNILSYTHLGQLCSRGFASLFLQRARHGDRCTERKVLTHTHLAIFLWQHLAYPSLKVQEHVLGSSTGYGTITCYYNHGSFIRQERVDYWVFLSELSKHWLLTSGCTFPGGQSFILSPRCMPQFPHVWPESLKEQAFSWGPRHASLKEQWIMWPHCRWQLGIIHF